ncbi:Scopoletin glucosyltransferase [Turnera subulata]|uniref:Scopoletin glucosyltransferase n=1 Tax=Turnera subulata TaxID=218843 RepID=A0A9Q0J806_9ROSI|nr:Scopoletin glucosyltransferase [Turnera subulata]
MAHGHTIPAMDMAKLFVSRGVKATIVTTPPNASYLSKTIERAQHLGLEIDI